MSSGATDDVSETGARRGARTTRVGSTRGASSRPTAGQAVGKSVAKAAKPLQPTAPARRALAARAAGSASIGPTAAQLLAAEEEIDMCLTFQSLRFMLAVNVNRELQQRFW